MEYARDLSLIVGETDRLSQSVTQLLSFARRQTAETVPLPVADLIHSIVALFRASADQHDIRLMTKVETDKELPGTVVPAVRDAVSNLLLNALQAIPDGGKVAIAASETGKELLITVEDSGPGIPLALAAKIWSHLHNQALHGIRPSHRAQANGRGGWLSRNSTACQRRRRPF